MWKTNCMSDVEQECDIGNDPGPKAAPPRHDIAKRTVLEYLGPRKDLERGLYREPQYMVSEDPQAATPPESVPKQHLLPSRQSSQSETHGPADAKQGLHTVVATDPPKLHHPYTRSSCKIGSDRLDNVNCVEVKGVATKVLERQRPVQISKTALSHQYLRAQASNRSHGPKSTSMSTPNLPVSDISLEKSPRNTGAAATPPAGPDQFQETRNIPMPPVQAAEMGPPGKSEGLEFISSVQPLPTLVPKNTSTLPQCNTQTDSPSKTNVENKPFKFLRRSRPFIRHAKLADLPKSRTRTPAKADSLPEIADSFKSPECRASPVRDEPLIQFEFTAAIMRDVDIINGELEPWSEKFQEVLLPPVVPLAPPPTSDPDSKRAKSRRAEAEELRTSRDVPTDSLETPRPPRTSHYLDKPIETNVPVSPTNLAKSTVSNRLEESSGSSNDSPSAALEPRPATPQLNSKGDPEPSQPKPPTKASREPKSTAQSVKPGVTTESAIDDDWSKQRLIATLTMKELKKLFPPLIKQYYDNRKLEPKSSIIVPRTESKRSLHTRHSHSKPAAAHSDVDVQKNTSTLPPRVTTSSASKLSVTTSTKLPQIRYSFASLPPNSQAEFALVHRAMASLADLSPSRTPASTPNTHRSLPRLPDTYRHASQHHPKLSIDQASLIPLNASATFPKVPAPSHKNAVSDRHAVHSRRS
ncbi:uncharacterized protein BJ171DRAFT_5033 [Polychytrium aggregatum]|uniref:uncharacterized protein n=1 Tax=Polychytrium aggregatum TaxID=110093 RepID=UPI0022FDD765|nr:uncharacterized protein BJ171DRAFT_5033 [Polychytrium aggregatum]KAI9209639.1 hypothetical protein BJ171DRAFT_5033 [Polychytrium aggregatum]